MARHDDDSCHEKAGPTDGRAPRRIDRRGLLQAAAGTALAAASVGVVGSAAGQTDSGPGTVVNLADEGLGNGDAIDPYLDEHFASGTEVRIPAGRYPYTGAGLGGEYENAALVGSDRGVVFERPSDPETAVTPTVFATGGTVRLANVTVRGKRGQTQSRWRLGAAEGGTLAVDNVNFPDGTVDGAASMGLYAGTDHAGALRISRSYFANFGSAACHVSDPQSGGNGSVTVEDCGFVDSGPAALRVGSDGTTVSGCHFAATATAPTGPNGAAGQRGVQIDAPGTDLVIEDCDFEWGEAGTSAITFDERGQGGNGVVRNVRVGYAGDPGRLFDVQWDVSGNWSGEAINFTEA